MELKKYENLVISGILEKFSDNEKNGVHKIDEKYIHSCIDLEKNEHGEWDVAHPDHFEYSLQCAWENDTDVKEAIEHFYEGVRVLYNGHMSVL